MGYLNKVKFFKTIEVFKKEEEEEVHVRQLLRVTEIQLLNKKKIW